MSDRRDVIYLYDGSFAGLLCSIFESYANRELPADIIEKQNVQEDFVYTYFTVPTAEEKSERVADGICQKICPEALECLYYLYLSDRKYKGRIALDYVRAGFRFGKDVNLHRTVDCVEAVLEAERRVRNEAHLFKEFIRFAELEGGIYYSEIEPACHVLPLIAPHFVKRFPQMPWIIHDSRRKLCMVYNGTGCCLMPTETLPRLHYTKEERESRKLWKNFYDTIEIRQRRNERCRMNHMPKRFWRNMPELYQEELL